MLFVISISVVAQKTETKNDFDLDEKERATLEAIEKEIKTKGSAVNDAWNAVRSVPAPITPDKAVSAVAGVQVAESQYREINTTKEYFLSILRSKRNCPDCVLSDDGKSLVKPTKEAPKK